jgi:hypothetical protein
MRYRPSCSSRGTSQLATIQPGIHMASMQPFTEKKQALHDLLAGTLVIKK